MRPSGWCFQHEEVKAPEQLWRGLRLQHRGEGRPQPHPSAPHCPGDAFSSGCECLELALGLQCGLWLWGYRWTGQGLGERGAEAACVGSLGSLQPVSRPLETRDAREPQPVV